MPSLIEGSISIDRLLAFIFGVVFIIVLLVFAIAIPNPTAFTTFVFRVVLSLAAAGVGAVLPGLLDVNLPLVRAGGALALATVVYFMNPPSLIRDTAEEQSRQSLNMGYFMINRGNLNLARDYIYKGKQLNPEPVDVPFCLA